MTFENIILEISENIATIRLNRPKTFNGINFDLAGDLAKALEVCMDDKDTKAVIITGEGKAFCAGGDMDLFKTSPNISDTLRELIKTFNVCIRTIRRMPKPVIAAINGAVGGGGMSLAAACDLRICASSARLRQAYTSGGLVPDGSWTLLVPLLIGFGKASELVFLDPVLDASKALECGLVNMVVEDGKLYETAFGIAAGLARGPIVAYRIAKENLNNAWFSLLDQQLELEARGMAAVGATGDAAEGIAAFIEKRKPAFSGS